MHDEQDKKEEFCLHESFPGLIFMLIALLTILALSGCGSKQVDLPQTVTLKSESNAGNLTCIVKLDLPNGFQPNSSSAYESKGVYSFGSFAGDKYSYVIATLFVERDGQSAEEFIETYESLGLPNTTIISSGRTAEGAPLFVFENKGKDESVNKNAYIWISNNWYLYLSFNGVDPETIEAIAQSARVISS